MTGDEELAQLGVAVLAAGNGALAAVLLSAGVPLSLDGGATTSILGGLGASGRRSIDLVTVADAEPRFWFAPAVLLLVLVAVATALALRQDSLADARREGFRFAGALAVLAFAAALLLRVTATSEGSALGVSGHGEASATFDPFVAALVLVAWGVVAGLLAPAMAMRVPDGLVATVRSRFGTAAAEPTAVTRSAGPGTSGPPIG